MASIVPHGTPDYGEIAALGYHPDDLLIFSSNVNPYGPPPAVLDALRRHCSPITVSRYPDRLSLDLRGLLADYHGVSPEQVIVSNGTADLMWLLAVIYLASRRVAILSPTFGEYENVASLVQATYEYIPLPGWRYDAERFYPADTELSDSAGLLSHYAPDVVFICNPNNPTGQWFPLQSLEQFKNAAPNALWIVDEAYAEFIADPWSSAQWVEHGNWLVLRSMTKDFALGGVRLGYAVGSVALIQELQAAQPPWNVNAFAQVAGVAAMQELSWREDTLRRLRQDREELQQALRNVGYAPVESTCNYFLVPVNDATWTRSQLLQERLMVRDCTSFGLPDFIRIATQKPEDNQILTASLAKLASAAARSHA